MAKEMHHTTTHSFIHIRLLKTEMTERICTSNRNKEDYKNSKNTERGCSQLDHIL